MVSPIKPLLALCLFGAALCQQAMGQTWDNTGNGLLKGTYYFRQVLWFLGDDAGDLGRAISVYGNITFDGNGTYSITNTQVFDSSFGNPQNFTGTGTYSIAASGYGFISSPLPGGDSIHGLVTKGIFTGSSTEGGYNDMFIAAPLASPAPTAASFRGAYSFVDMDFPSGSPLDTRESQFQLNPDGAGNIGIVRATGFISGGGTTPITQNFSGVRYVFSNGGANVSFGGSLSATGLLAGNKYLYFSPDGDFVFGGSPTAFDMIVGVRSGTTPTFGGQYYQAGAVQDESTLSSGFANLFTFYGSLKVLGTTSVLAHQRLYSGLDDNTFDYAYADPYTLKSDGSYDDTNSRFLFHNIFGSNGAIRIGIGIPPYIGITVAVQTPATFEGTGVFINPTGVVNAASSAPFTTGIAPGELITIYGTNLAADSLYDFKFPLTLGKVQVMINNRPAPIFSVSPGQVSAVVPYATTEVIAAIQVINNGVTSNTVTSYTNLTAPGIFTNPAGGVAPVNAQHSDYTAITPANPAQVGDSISLYVSGLGDVSPAVPDATPGPIDPLSKTTNPFAVYIDGVPATIGYSGLAPLLTGYYQMNVTVPAGVRKGDAVVEILGPDFYTSEATVPIGSTGAAASAEVRRPATTGSAAGKMKSSRRAQNPNRVPMVRKGLPFYSAP